MPLTSAAIEIFLLTLVLSLANSLIRRALIKEDDIRKMMEANEYRRAMLKALKEKDKKTIEKLERRKDYIQRLEAQTAMKNLIIMAISFGLFFTFFIWATAHYVQQTVLTLPPGIEIPFLSDRGSMHFYGWYILSSLALSLPINKYLTRQMPTIWGGQEHATTKPKVEK